jgi:hypothetical protein
VGVDARRQAVAPFEPAALEDLAARLGRHARPKTMNSRPVPYPGLVNTLRHGENRPAGRVENERALYRARRPRQSLANTTHGPCRGLLASHRRSGAVGRRWLFPPPEGEG